MNIEEVNNMSFNNVNLKVTERLTQIDQYKLPFVYYENGTIKPIFICIFKVITIYLWSNGYFQLSVEFTELFQSLSIIT